MNNLKLFFGSHFTTKLSSTIFTSSERMGSYFRNIETPSYKVLSKHKEYEIRKYGPRVEVCTLMEESDGLSFSRLAAYIGVMSEPENVAQGIGVPERIAMTAPVVMKPSSEKIEMTAPVITGNGRDGGESLMSFILPSKYTLKTAPKPTNPKVFLRSVQDNTQAVSTFNGYYRVSTCREKVNELFAALRRDGVNFERSNWVLMGYDSPRTPSPLRRNEISVPVEVK